MPKFAFSITAPATVTARVCIEADSIEEAQAMALTRSFYTDPDNAQFELDDGNDIRDVYLPDDEDYEVIEESPGLSL